jgi:hypothetical protein
VRPVWMCPGHLGIAQMSLSYEPSIPCGCILMMTWADIFALWMVPHGRQELMTQWSVLTLGMAALLYPSTEGLG